MAHHGARNSRLTRLMKRRSRVAHGGDAIPHIETPLSAIPPSEMTHRLSDGIAPDGESQDGTMPEEVASAKASQSIDLSEDKTKVMATVVNVIDDEPQTSSDGVGLTLGPVPSLFDGPSTATPAYNSLTADTPSLTSSQTSMASATSSAYLSALTSRPLINSSIPSSSSSPTPSPSSSSGSSSNSDPSSSSTTSSASRVTRSSTKTSAATTSSTSSSITSLISSSTTSSTTSTTSTTSSTTSSDSSYSDAFGSFGGGGSYTSGAPGPTSTGSDPSGTGPSLPPTTGKIVGGVVGSVAGIAMLLLMALFVFHRRRVAMRKPRDGLPSSEGAGAAAAAGAGSMARFPEMTSRWSTDRDSMFTASYFAPAFMKKWRQSTQTTKTEDTLIGSEGGFQKVSGRKIPSVLTSGGDGYGGGYETGSSTVSEPSMTAPSGSPVIPRSPATQPPPSTPFGMPLDVNYTREAEETDPAIFVRSGPARTPVTGGGTASISSVSAPINIPRVPSRTLSPAMSSRPDTLRSQSSYDGSRGSRFTESL